ncbi:hypothetical protein [Frankia sp. AgKG'84/4]|uniref:hypothetical protein n=1 Tax=Frankia sp. AgKG'84/4 TaxID=573490 RepID=UPI00200BBCA2|nr:hypothetical protein [Frankia sp. AgKG'84/4]MCL9793494.1 hypothetical protein [Frankia sp. AgKG'84/4]
MAGGEMPRPERRDTPTGLEGWRLADDFARYVFSSWAITLRFVLVLSVPTVSAMLVVVALVQVPSNPLWLLGCIPSAVLVTAFTKFLRVLRRRRAMTGTDRY